MAFYEKIYDTASIIFDSSFIQQLDYEEKKMLFKEVEEKTNRQVDILCKGGDIHMVRGPVEEILKTEQVLESFQRAKLERDSLSSINTDTSKKSAAIVPDGDLLNHIRGNRDASINGRTGVTVLKNEKRNKTRAGEERALSPIHSLERNKSTLSEQIVGCDSYVENKKTETERNAPFNHTANNEKKPEEHSYRSCINGTSCQSACHSPGTSLSDQVTSMTIPIDENLWRYLIYYTSEEYATLCRKHGCNVMVKYSTRDGKKECHLEFSSLSSPEKIPDALRDFAVLYEKVKSCIQVHTAVLPVGLVWKDIQRELKEDGAMLLESYSLVCPIATLDKAQERIEEFRQKFEAELIPPSDTKCDHFRILLKNGLIVHILQGDLVEQSTDVIVNPTNKHLKNLSGASRIISQAAGQELQDECRAYINKHGSLKTSYVMHTSAGKLQPRIKYVIHAPGPLAHQVKDSQKCNELLRATFKNCLSYANDVLNVESISLPAISSGLAGVPRLDVAEAACWALNRFDKKSSTAGQCLKEVYIVGIDPETIQVMEATFNSEQECAGYELSMSSINSVTKDGSPNKRQLANGSSCQKSLIYKHDIENDSDFDVESELPSITNLVAGLSKENKQRQQLINELFHTERVHVRTLKIMKLIFIDPMCAASWIEPSFISLLFPSFDEVLSAHSSLNKDFRELKKVNPLVGDIGRILLNRFSTDNGSQFKVPCAKFCEDQLFAQDMLKKKQSEDPNLLEFLQAAVKDPLCKRFQLKDFLPQVMSRLAKYPLIVASIIKCTNRDTEEFDKLTKTLVCLTQILEYVNEAMKKCENARKVKDIQTRLEEGDSVQTNMWMPKLRKHSTTIRELEKVRRTKSQTKDFEQCILEKRIWSIERKKRQELKDYEMADHQFILDDQLTWRLNQQKSVSVYLVLFDDLLVFLKGDDQRLQILCHDELFLDDIIDRHEPLLKLTDIVISSHPVDDKVFCIKNTARDYQYDIVVKTKSQKSKWVTAIVDAASGVVHRRTSQLVPTPLDLVSDSKNIQSTPSIHEDQGPILLQTLSETNEASDDSSSDQVDGEVEEYETKDRIGGYEDREELGGTDTEEVFQSPAASRSRKAEENLVAANNSASDTQSNMIDGDSCCICVDSMTNPKELPCEHTFCTDCIDAYLEKHGSCPSCA